MAVDSVADVLGKAALSDIMPGRSEYEEKSVCDVTGLWSRLGPSEVPFVKSSIIAATGTDLALASVITPAGLRCTTPFVLTDLDSEDGGSKYSETSATN